MLLGALGRRSCGRPTHSTVTRGVSSAFGVERPYESKTVLELVRAIVVFKLCHIRPFVAHGDTLLRLSRLLFRDPLVKFGLKRTFFAHFCAGETEEELSRTVSRLQKLGVGSILDYAAEASTEASHSNSSSARTQGQYDSAQERLCDARMTNFLTCVAAAQANMTPALPGFMAIKLSSISNPVLLKRIGDILSAIQQRFQEFVPRDGEITADQFLTGIQKIGVPMQPDAARELFARLDTNHNGVLDDWEWAQLLSPTCSLARPFFEAPRIAATSTSTSTNTSTSSSRISSSSSSGSSPVGALPSLTAEELVLVENLNRRLTTIAEACVKANVRLLIDAEQSYVQRAIDFFTCRLQMQYNKTSPAVYNTYQCYLTRASKQFENDSQRAQRYGLFFAAKLVRGAYMEQERRLAKEHNEADPIHPNIEATHACFDSLVSNIIDRRARGERVAAILCTHNAHSVASAITRLKTEPAACADNVAFAQLLGMADHLTLPLGKGGFQVYKYVPYGPVLEVVPYLMRRAQENSGMLASSNSDVEASLMWKELLQRLRPRHTTHKS